MRPFVIPTAPPPPPRLDLPEPALAPSIAPFDRDEVIAEARAAAREKLAEYTSATSLEKLVSEEAALGRMRDWLAPPVGVENASSIVCSLSALGVVPFLSEAKLREVWRETPASVWRVEPAALRYLLAVLGEEALPKLRTIAMLAELSDDGFEHLRAWWVAPALSWSMPAHAWLVENVELATMGLVYGSLAHRDARAAQSHLRWLARRDGGERALRVAKERWGAAAEEAIRDVLRVVHETPPPFARPLPKMFAKLPMLKLADGTVATREQMDAFAKILAQGLPMRHPALAALLAACDRASAASTVRALFDAWVDGNMAVQNRWIADAYAVAGGDEAARELGRLARKWSRARPSHERRAARFAATVLGQIATDAALGELGAIAASARDEETRTLARDALTKVAWERGENADDLAAPAFDAFREPVVLDYGARVFRGTLDRNLVPRVLDEGGRALDDLPRPTKKDDAAKARAAKEAWKELKEAARDAVSMETARLESAMVDERAFTVEKMRQRVLAPAISSALARRVVWRVIGGGLFRVAEDGTFADASDVALDLPDGTAVAVAHPLHWSAEDRERWSKVLADYELIQPFDQIARATFANGAPIAEWHAHPGALLALGSGKWRLLRDRYAHGLERKLATGRVVVAFAPGFAPEAPRDGEMQRFVDLRVSGHASEIALSEAYRDLFLTRASGDL